MNQAQWHLHTEFGSLFLIASEKGLQALCWKKSKTVPFVKSLEEPGKASEILATAEKQLKEFFEGLRKNFDIPLDLQGSHFQKLVWREVRRIPMGKTLSYTQLAKKLHREKAVRAVGRANSQNPLSIIIPCHRLIGADGQLRGYSAGIKIKRRLLEWEWVETYG